MTDKITNKHLMAKARGFTISIDKMDANQRISFPTNKYGNDYNNFLKLTTQEYPGLASLLPPPATLGDYSIEESYGEIHTYCEQIFQLLAEQ